MAVAAVRALRPRPVVGRRIVGTRDDRLVGRVRAGDEAAFEIVYDRYHRGLLAFCRHMLGNREEAEDVLQHTFVSAFRALRAGSDDVNLKPWLYAIARNRCLSSIRARREQVELGEVSSRPSCFDGLADEVEQRDELRELVGDLQRLPEQQRAAIVLFELGDHSHEEIAAVLDVRTEKVKALVFQAREGLLRARRARDTPCAEIREQLATLTGRSLRRGAIRRHVDGCRSCAGFEVQIRRQRSSFALIMPVVPALGLKASVLGTVFGGGGGVVAVTSVGAGAGATAAVGAGTGGGGLAAASAGTVTAGVASTGAGGVAGGLVGVGVVAEVGVTAGGVAGGLASLGVNGVVAKILTVAVVAGGGAGYASTQEPSPAPVPALERPMAASPATSPVAPASSAVPPTVAPTLTAEAASPPPPVADRAGDAGPPAPAVLPPESMVFETPAVDSAGPPPPPTELGSGTASSPDVTVVSGSSPTTGVTSAPADPAAVLPGDPAVVPGDPVAPTATEPGPVLGGDPVAPDPVAPDPVAPDPLAPDPVAPDPLAPAPVAPDPSAPLVGS